MTDAPPPDPSEQTPDPARALGRPTAPSPGTPEQPTSAPTPPDIRDLPLRFTGTAGEYFRIWTVNVALTIVTLGLYTPWARVRTRSYFYGHTLLAGEHFSYTASPVALFRGYLLVGVLFVVYLVSQSFEQYAWVAALLLALFFALFPYLLYRSLRFNAANSVYRGLSFGFTGTAGGAYVAYLAILLTLPFSLGLTYPLVLWMQRRYVVEHLAYGSARTRWGRDVGPVYLYFLYLVLGMTGVVVVLGGIGAAIWYWGGLTGRFSGSALPVIGATGLAGFVVLAYAAYILLLLGAQHYMHSALLAYSLQGLYLGQTVRLQNTIRPLALAWVEVSNLAAQLLTLGLLTPWAAVRRTRYIVERVQVQTVGSLDDFHAAAKPAESALGAAANEFFNFDIGF